MIKLKTALLIVSVVLLASLIGNIYLQTQLDRSSKGLFESERPLLKLIDKAICSDIVLIRTLSFIIR
ncbi:MAG: hypothetical protein K0Q87_5400 [Neobacillus sp.]|jgi:hypothetical protein|nr:hypothetical protein [Neobacillus sp.]